MTTTAPPPGGHYRFSHVARMEWVKLRSLRSTWWSLALSLAGALAIAIAVGADTTDAAGDLTNNALAGIIPGLLLVGVLGVVTMTSEYTTGMIAITLAAAPNRSLLLVAKATVFGALALVAGEGAAFLSFFAGGAALPSTIAAPTLGEPGVLRAVVLSGAGICLVGLMGLGLGAIIRHTAAAVTVLVGLVFVAAQLVAALAHSLLPYLPIGIVANALAAVTPPWTGLSPWAGLAMLCLYATIVLGLGACVLTRRDA